MQTELTSHTMFHTETQWSKYISGTLQPVLSALGSVEGLLAFVGLTGHAAQVTKAPDWM